MNTKHIENKDERKAAKRAARKKADTEKPLQPRPDSEPRGSNKRKVKKLVKGQSKR